MFEFIEKRFGKSWLSYNIQALLLSVLICVLIIGMGLFSSGIKHFNALNIVTTFIYCLCISFLISNTIQLLHTIPNFKKLDKRIRNLILVAGIFVAMMGGYFIAAYFHALIDKRDYSIIDLLSNISYFPFAIGLAGGFVGLQFASLKEEMKIKLQEKELQISKLNEQHTQAQLQSLQAKINPHFLYNALNSIASLIHESPNKAEEMTLNLSKFYRYSINKNEGHWSTLKEEMEIVDTYLKIESLRFEDRLAIKVLIPTSLLEAKIPRFLLQPMVENAFKHGISKMAGNAVIEIMAIEEDNKIKISVHDNGPSFSKDLTTGYGLKSLYDKLNLLYGKGYEVTIVNEPKKKIEVALPKSSINSIT